MSLFPFEFKSVTSGTMNTTFRTSALEMDGYQYRQPDNSNSDRLSEGLAQSESSIDKPQRYSPFVEKEPVSAT